MSQTFTDPTSGRQYSVDPITGQSRWVDQVPPPRTGSGGPTPLTAPPAQGGEKARSGGVGKAMAIWGGVMVAGLIALVAVSQGSGGTSTATPVAASTVMVTSSVPPSDPVSSQEERPTPSPSQVERSTPAVSTAVATYAKLTDRSWALVAKNPDRNVGKALIVYGVVTQFDAATGEDTFRANVEGTRRAGAYDYDVNSILVGDPDELANLVEGDIFQAKVIIAGSRSYDTAIGGNMTAPLMSVSSFKVIGHRS